MPDINEFGLQFNPNSSEDSEPLEHDASVKTNINEGQHPLYSSDGLIEVINAARNRANSKEDELSGTIKDKVFADTLLAASKTQFPPDLLLFMMDWENDITKRGDGSDAESIANKMLSNLEELRSTFGRDPTYGEVFAAYVLGGASEVKQRQEKSENDPDKEADAPSGKKGNIVGKKLRNKEEVKRTNRELYTFFFRRIAGGNIAFTELLGKPTT